MPDETNQILLKMLETFMQKVDGLGREISELKGTIQQIRIHDAPCKFLENYEQKMDSEIKSVKTKQSGDTSKLHNKVEEHIRDCHSSSSEFSTDRLLAKHVDDYHSSITSRANWAVIAAAISAVITIIGFVLELKGGG